MSSFARLESARRSQGYELIGGIDEVGRGAWAGPLVAAAIILKPYARLPDLRDSKQLTRLQRENYVLKIARGAVTYRWGVVSAREIDDIGIAEANRLAFRRAINALSPKPDYVLADYFSLDGWECPVEGIKGGDERVRGDEECEGGGGCRLISSIDGGAPVSGVSMDGVGSRGET